MASYSPTTSATISVSTDFGIDTNYGTSLTSGNVTVDASNYKDAAYQTTTVSTGDTQRGTITNNAIYKMLNVNVPDVYTKTNFVATNGQTYQYKVTATHGDTSLSQHKIVYTSTWGIGNYNNTYGTTHTLTLTTSNYNTANITTTNRTTQATNTENYLNTLIGNVSTPSNITNTFTTASGQKFYVKTTATGSNSSITATSCQIKYTTVYGLTNSYGTTYSSNVVFTITASNYQTWQTEYAAAVATEQNKIKTLAMYGMLNTALPNELVGTYTATSTGVTYKYKITPTQGEANSTTNTINYITTFGTWDCTDDYTTYTLTLTTSNYNTANITTNAITTQLNNLESYLETVIPPYTVPQPTVTSYTSSTTGCTWYIKAKPVPSSSDSRFQTTAKTLNFVLTHGNTSSTQNCGLVDIVFGTLSVTTSNYQTLSSAISSKITELTNSYKTSLDNVISTYYTVSYSPVTATLASGVSISYQASAGYSKDKTDLVQYVDSSNRAWVNSYTSYSQIVNIGYWISGSNISYTDKGLQCTINASNFKSQSTVIWNATVSRIRAYDCYKILNITKSNGKTSSYTTGGKTYYYQIAFTQGPADLFSNSFDYTVKWGTTSGDYTNTAAISTICFGPADYSNASTTFNSVITAEENALKTYLDNIPGTTGVTVNVVTDYGINTSYGTALASGTVTVNASNYKNAAYQSTITSTGDTQRGTITSTDVYKMLNVNVPDVVTKTDFVATNGQTYQYKVTATHGTTSLSQHKIVYTTTWGIGNYNNTYATTHTLTLTTSNYNTANITTTNRSTQVTNTETYLNTLIGNVSTPSDITNTFSTASGQTFYVKTTASGSNSSITATSCAITYTTVYGLSNSYGNTYSSNLTFTVNSSNYQTWSTDYASAVATEQDKIKNLNTYKMLNVALPGVSTKTNYVATNGLTYQYKVTATNGTCNLTKREIIYTTTWGIDNYNNTWGTKHTLTLTTSNYSTANITTTNRSTQVTNTENYLNTLIGTYSAPSAVTETYTGAPNGLTYYIKTTYTGSNNSISATSGTLTATTTWGTTSGTYNHSYTDGNTASVSIGPSNFQTRETEVTSIGSTQRTNLKDYLDTLIGTVSTPSDSTTTFSTASGKTFYVKTTFTGSNNTETATSCTVKYTTVYGLSTSYGNNYSSNVEFVVTPSNYSSWTTSLASAVSTEQDKIKTTNSYKMLNVSLPSVYTKTSFVATNGKTYQYKVTATNGTASLTERNIIYTSTWGIGNYNNTWGTTHTLTLTTSNYNTSNITTTNRTTQATATENYLNTLIHNVSTPSDITTSFTTNSGQTFYLKTTATGSNSSITATSCTIKYTTVYGLSTSYGNTLSTNVEFTIESDDYPTWSTDYASAVAAEQETVKNLATYKMLDVALPSTATNTSYIATNGKTYQYKVTATNGTCNLTKREIVYTSTWGIGNYNNTYGTTHTLTLTTSNYNTSNITINNRATQVTNTENYLNTLIHTVSTPSQSTTTFSTASGKTFYVKTTATGSNSSITATSCQIKYTTVYGLTNSYGTTYSTDVVFTVTPSNYSSWSTDYASAVSTEQAKVKTTNSYKMLNVALPSAASGQYAATNGLTYQYKVTATNGTASLTERNIVYTSTYGIGNYNNTWDTTHTLTLTTSNYNTSNITTTNMTTQVTATQNYLDTLIGTYSAPTAVTETYTEAPNGLSYYIKTTFTGSNSSMSATSGTLTATTTWGTTSGTYNQSYDDGNTSSISVTPSNFQTRESEVTTIGTTQRTNLKAYLDTLIGTVSTPSDSTTTFSTNSGQTFYVKTTASGSNSSITATSCTITYTTVYGLTNSYGNTYSTNIEFIITPSNYSTWTTSYNSAVSTEQNKIKNLNTYKMLNVALPSVSTKTDYVATNGLTYQYKVTATNGTCNLTKREIVYTTTWGIGNYNNTWGTTHTLTLTTSNYSTSNITTTNRTTQATATENYLNTLIGNVSAPSDITNTYSTASGKTFYVKTTASGSNSSITATSCTITYTTVYGLTNSYGTTLSTDLEFTITSSNYNSWSTTYTSTVGSEQDKVKDLTSYKMLNLALPSVYTKTGYVATNGLTYQYKVTATNGTASLTERNIVYTSTWGIGNYNNTWNTTHTLTLTTSNYNTSNITTTNRTTQATATETYLNTLIGSVTKPSDSTTTFSTASGQTFYVKTTATGSNTSVTATSCQIKYTTVYGLTNSYGTTYSTNVVFTVTPSNYQSWSTDYASAVSTEQAKVKTTNSYKMLNVALPSNHNDSYTAANGLTYSFTSTYTQGTANLTQNNIICTTTWTRQDSTVKTYDSVTTTLTTSNYTSATTNLSSDLGTLEGNLKGYLDTLLVMPTNYSNTYTKNGFKYYFEIYYTIPDEESHEVTATAKIDLITLKSTTVTCTDMNDFGTQKATIESTKISEMQAAVVDSPSNSTSSYGGFSIKSTYSKKAKTTSSVDAKVYCNLSLEDYVVNGPINLGSLTSFTNYKFVYTTIISTITAKVNELKGLIDTLPTNGSYTYQPTDTFATAISYTYSRVGLLYTLAISIDGTQIDSVTTYLRIYEIDRLKAKMGYLLSRYQSKIKNVMPKDVEKTYNDVTVSKKFSKNANSNTVTCKLYVDGVLKSTYTDTFNLSNTLLKESLQSLGDGDFNEYKSNAQSMNISISSSSTITSGGKTRNVSILTEKVGNKLRVYRVIGNIKTNYIDVDINYLNANTTKTAVQNAANTLLSNLNTLIDFYRPPSEAALVELLKVSTVV